MDIFKYKYSIKWLLAITVTVMVILLYQFNVFERLELLTLDYRFILRHPKPQPSKIVFIDMAEDSIRAIGRWPWPRKWHAALIKALSDYHPNVIAFDVIFSEPQDEADDVIFEEAIKQSGRVYLPLSYDLDEKRVKDLYKGDGIISVVEPLPAFKRYTKGIGHINVIPSMDGILRKIPPIINYDADTTYQLGMKIGFDYIGIKEIFFYPDRHAIFVKSSGSKLVKIPLTRDNQLIINWHGRWGEEFPHYSYIDVIRSYASLMAEEKPVIDLNVFKDKICIIGLTALGLTDIKPIPIQNAYPAVGINAMVVNSVINNDFINEVPRKINICLIFLVAMLTAFYLSNLRFLSGIFMGIASIVLYALISIGVFNFFNTSIATFYPILAIGLSYLLTSMYTQVLQSIERAHLFRQATRDGLTYLYNVRHFNLLLEAEFKNVSLYKLRPLSLIMSDLDNFKHLNDTYGHQAGDTILREAAKVMQSKCRQTDVVARYGGEEFIIMLSGAKEKDALDIAEKIRAAIESKKFKFKNDTYTQTVSIGVVQYSNEKDKDELIGRADKALYKAKHEGKNRVCSYVSCD